MKERQQVELLLRAAERYVIVLLRRARAPNPEPKDEPGLYELNGQLDDMRTELLNAIEEVDR